MVAASHSLPPRFPCWVKAVYSWGGETKRDLGFIEGDLIECLNAGDGSWWMGRLRRDRRMVGLFPSNFVEVLPDDFQPLPVASRNASPLPMRENSANNKTPQKAKSTFRKPFQAYYKASSPNAEAAKRDSDGSTSTPNGSIRKHRPYSSMKRPSDETRASPTPHTPQPKTESRFGVISPAPRGHYSQPRAVSPAPSGHYNQPRAVSPAPNAHYNHPRAISPAPPVHYNHPRAVSPAPSTHYSHPRAVSPAPYTNYATQSPVQPSQYSAFSPAPSAQYHPYSRAPSPAPPTQYQAYSRGPSPNPYDEGSPPPPAPPPHRHAASRVPSPQPHQRPQYDSGYHTPDPATPAIGHTPSPIANAMNDVMNCIEDMAIAREPSPAPERNSPPSVWSPEAFDELYPSHRKPGRPHTSLALGGKQDSGYGEGMLNHSDSLRSNDPPQLDNYVERMEARLRKLHEQEGSQPGDHSSAATDGPPPDPPPKNVGYQARPQSSLSIRSRKGSKRGLKQMKSTYELGKEALNRTFTLKSTTTNSSNSTSATNHTLMSDASAGAFSATSAGSFYRRKWPRTGDQRRPMSVMDLHSGGNGADFGVSRPHTPSTGISYHSSHDSMPNTPGTVQQPEWMKDASETSGVLGGLATPKARKSGFFKKMIESAKTGAASARSTISSSGPSTSRPSSPEKRSMLANGVTSIAGGTSAPPRPQSSAARDMGIGGAVDWVQVRRDVNRSNSVSKNERLERAERCQMLDLPAISSIDALHETAEGDEGLDGLPISEPTDFGACNLSLVDKSARFVSSLPAGTTAAALVQGYLCRPYRSDVQRLRAIFTWASERISWEEDFEMPETHVDTRRVIQTNRGCSQEIAFLVAEMCAGVGIHAEVVKGYLKMPGEQFDFDHAAHPNHWWNAVIIDGEWRILDCSLAGPTNAKRKFFSSVGAHVADAWYFLTRPMQICYTHVPLLPEQQHIVPPVAVEVLMALPCASAPYFKNGLHVIDFNTSCLHLENLELAHIHIAVPEDVECVAEVEVRAFAQDADGDFFESGDVIRKPALSQAEWLGGRKRFNIKALLPGDEGQGVLKIYAGKRGLMHSIKSNPHGLALALPLTHTGSNPPYTFFTRHPTPHAQRHDLYVIQPQCSRLFTNNTFVFSVRQHSSSLSMSSPALGGSVSGVTFSSVSGRSSPNPIMRPASALSMASVSASGSNYSSGSGSNPSTTSSGSGAGDPKKPAKLAIQSPTGKIIRLTRKGEHQMTSSARELDGTEWETIIKIGERGTWRGLVLADRSARWCVFAEWECV